MHIFCLDYTVSVSKSYPLRVQNKLTTSIPMRCPSFESVAALPHLSPSVRHELASHFSYKEPLSQLR